MAMCQKLTEFSVLATERMLMRGWGGEGLRSDGIFPNFRQSSDAKFFFSYYRSYFSQVFSISIVSCNVIIFASHSFFKGGKSS